MSATHAQPTFEKFYESATSYSFDLNELPGSNILTCMGATHLLDPQGGIEFSSSYYGGGTYLTQTLKTAEENVFYFTTATVAVPCSTENASLFRPVLGKMDSLGSVALMQQYELNSVCVGLLGGLEITADQGAITWGRDYGFFAMRVDSSFQPVWTKRVLHGGGFAFIKEPPGGDLLAGINLDTAGAVVARLDEDGSVLWCKSYIRPKGMVHDAVIESDSAFVITGYTDSTNLDFFLPLPATFQPKLFMMKLDGDGEVQWCRGYDSSPYDWHTPNKFRIVQAHDGNYIVLATLGQPGYNQFFRPFLMKTYENGDTLWTRSIGRPYYTYITQDVLPYSDGGLMFSGIIYGDFGLNSGLKYIFKTDSMGHFPCWEQVHTVQVHDLFPTDSSFTLITEGSLSNATQIVVNDSIVDTDLFTVYDGCTFQPMSMDSSIPRSRPPRVRPNPNTGHFTVEFADPPLAESYYSVYDGLGKLLYQRPLPTGATLEEVDLSRFDRGSYVIKFTSPDGVCHERVVLE